MVTVAMHTPIEQVVADLQRRDIEIWVEEGRLCTRAAPGSITSELRTVIQTRKADILTFLQQAHDDMAQPPLAPVMQKDSLPLSFAQQRIWFLEQMGVDHAYKFTYTLHLQGTLNLTALHRALSEIVRRHATLRTTFTTVDGIPQQSIQPPVALDLPLIDLLHLTPDEQDEAVTRLTHAEAQQQIDLTQDLLIRTKLLRLHLPGMAVDPMRRGEEHLLIITMHHIAFDGWSLNVLLQELEVLYTAFVAGKSSPLPELPLQYADFAVWQRAWLQDDVLERQLTYWQKQLAGVPTLLQLPADRPRPSEQSFRGGRVTFVLEAATVTALKQLGQQAGSTLFMTLLAAFQVLLYRYTQQADFVIGTPIANRQRAELESLIGLFANTLALRADLHVSHNQPLTFIELLARVRQSTQDAYDHQDLPFERLVDALQVERTFSHNPLVQVAFALMNAPLDTLALPGLASSRLVLNDVQSTRFDLELHLFERAGALDGYCIYSTDLFEQATIERLVGHYQTLLAAIVANPEQSIAALPLLTAAERQQVLVDWNDTATAYPKDQCIHQLFEAQAARTPDAVAVLFDSGEQQGVDAGTMQNGHPQSPNHPIFLTYRELNVRANQLAHYLRTLGVGSTLGAETLVGLCVDRSLEMVVGLLAILKAGGAYVPLDPNYPTERLALMINDAQVPVLLTQASLVPQLAPCPAQTICLDRDWAHISTYNANNLTHPLTPAHLAYVIYTSGSTGRPKGVLIEHKGLCNVVAAQQRQLGVSAADHVLQFSSLSFDAATFEVFMALGAGATLYVSNRESLAPGEPLYQFLERNAISVVTLTPSTLAAVPTKPLPALHTVTVAGEACSAALVNQWGAGRRFFNLYGPTEATIWATTFACPVTDQTPAIGGPIDNVQVYLLDQARQPVPIGVPGELYIGGGGVARGYLQHPELTAEKFIANPFGAGRLYKTGDLVRWLPDGNIEFLGRIDQQVKLRGFRIELGEIEAVLTAHPAVQEAVVMAQEEAPGEKRLVAYVTGEQGNSVDDETLASDRQFTPSALRDYLRSKLPDYMVPSAFVLLDALPLTPNGKVDRKALSVPVRQSLLSKDFVPPQTETEALIAAIWMEVLGLSQIGIHDDFFAIGGHSLLATQVISRLSQAFQINLPLRSLFEDVTIVTLAQRIDILTVAQALQSHRKGAAHQRKRISL